MTIICRYTIIMCRCMTIKCRCIVQKHDNHVQMHSTSTLYQMCRYMIIMYICTAYKPDLERPVSTLLDTWLLGQYIKSARKEYFLPDEQASVYWALVWHFHTTGSFYTFGMVKLLALLKTFARAMSLPMLKPFGTAREELPQLVETHRASRYDGIYIYIYICHV